MLNYYALRSLFSKEGIKRKTAIGSYPKRNRAIAVMLFADTLEELDISRPSQRSAATIGRTLFAKKPMKQMVVGRRMADPSSTGPRLSGRRLPRLTTEFSLSVSRDDALGHHVISVEFFKTRGILLLLLDSSHYVVSRINILPPPLNNCRLVQG